MQELGICVIMPTYNNAKTLENVINGVLCNTNDLIVVNDGSTDETANILEKYNNIYKLSNETNRGKGIALRKAIGFAIEHGFNYAISIDSDGQHTPDDIQLFVEKLEQTDEALIIGVRKMDQSLVPGKSYFGREFSNFWFRIETGINNPDSQSGFRLYPLKPMMKIKLLTARFEFEIEIMVRLAWRGVKIETVPVSVVYFPKEERVSHFRPFKDFARISILNTILVTLAIFYYRPKLFFSKKKFSELLINKNESNFTKAISISFGVFMGILPIWGFQLIAAIAIAVLLKLNKPLVIIFANISIPPLIPVILYASLECGRVWINNPIIPDLNKMNFEIMKPYFLQYIFGSLTLAVSLAIITGLIVYLLLKLFRKEAQAL